MIIVILFLLLLLRLHQKPHEGRKGLLCSALGFLVHHGREGMVAGVLMAVDWSTVCSFIRQQTKT